MRACTVKKILTSLGLALAFLFALPVPAAFAHAQLISVSPTNGSVLEGKPELVEIEYSEAIKAASSGSIFILDSNAEKVADVSFSIENNIITIKLPNDLTPGGYVAVWKVVSADGHVVGSASTFAYGAFTPPDLESLSIPGAPETNLFDPLKILFNVALFFSTAILFSSSPRIIRVIRLGSLIAVGIGAITITKMSLEYGGITEAILLGETQSFIAKTVGAALLFLASVFPAQRLPLGIVGLAAITLSAFLYGHANGLEDNGIIAFFFAAHIGAALVWTSGVIALMLDPDVNKAKEFGKWAIPSIVVLLISALTTAFALGWNPFNMWTWDNVLTVKVSVVATALILGVIHHLMIRRATSVALKKLRIGFAIEAILILAVAGGSSSLSATPAPVFASANQVYQASGAANQIFLADGTPISVYFSDVTSGTILSVRVITEIPVDSVEILLSHEESGISDLPAILTSSENGTEFNTEIVWAFPGLWKADIKVEEDQFTVRLGSLDVYVVPAGTHQH